MLKDELNGLGAATLPKPSARHILSENDLAVTLLRNFGDALEALATEIFGKAANIHYDAPAKLLTRRRLPAGADRCRPDLVVLVPDDVHGARIVSLVELKSAIALPNDLLDTVLDLVANHWKVSFEDGITSVFRTDTEGRYQLRRATQEERRAQNDHARLARHLLDVAGYITALDCTYGILLNGVRHVLIRVNKERRTVSCSRPFGADEEDEGDFDRPRSLFWLQAVLLAAARMDME